MVFMCFPLFVICSMSTEFSTVPCVWLVSSTSYAGYNLSWFCCFYTFSRTICSLNPVDNVLLVCPVYFLEQSGSVIGIRH